MDALILSLSFACLLIVIACFLEKAWEFVLAPFIIGSLLLFFYLNSVALSDWKIEEKICTARVIDNVSFINHDNKIINLNQKLQRNIEDGTKIKAQKYKPGWYCGVYCIMTPDNKYSIEEQND